MAGAMPDAGGDSRSRFTDRVDDYARYRPGYPAAVVDVLRASGAIGNDWVIADIGSGTGLSSALFLDAGCEVYGVEPNAAMRAAAERILGGRAGFHSRAGTAEATGLPDRSVDCVVAGQAFHWFDAVATRREFARILRPPGAVALMWNTRRTATTPFLASYETLLLEYGTDYREVDHRKVTDDRLRAFFSGTYRKHVFSNAQHLDFEGLRGRVLSSSYTPNAGDPRRAPMLAALERLFDAAQENGRVRIDYDTEVYVGRVALDHRAVDQRP
jgi:SAM-dependent methyltransferase